MAGLLLGVINTAFTVTPKYEPEPLLITGSCKMPYAVKSTLTFLWEKVHFNTEWSKTVNRGHLKAKIINYGSLEQNNEKGKTINLGALNGRFHCIERVKMTLNIIMSERGNL
jgi:hypothetical protein